MSKNRQWKIGTSYQGWIWYIVQSHSQSWHLHSFTIADTKLCSLSIWGSLRWKDGKLSSLRRFRRRSLMFQQLFTKLQPKRSSLLFLPYEQYWLLSWSYFILFDCMNIKFKNENKWKSKYHFFISWKIRSFSTWWVFLNSSSSNKAITLIYSKITIKAWLKKF